MDYMREVGSRQRKVLAALLMGRSENTAEELQRAKTEQESRTKSEETVRGSYQNETDALMRKGTGVGSEQADTKQRSVLTEQAEEINLLRPAEADQTTPDSTGNRQSKQLGYQAEEYQLYRGADMVWREENAASGQQRERNVQTAAIVGAWDAAAMSRIFQRDARRYDGSFRTD